MPDITIHALLQLIVAAGLLNVWLIRSGSATSYRGGTAQNLKDEFAAYGLPEMAYSVVGVLKVGSAVALLVGLWLPSLVAPAATIVLVLMVGALVMHFKVKDPLMKSLPAFLMLLMSAGILFL